MYIQRENNFVASTWTFNYSHLLQYRTHLLITSLINTHPPYLNFPTFDNEF